MKDREQTIAFEMNYCQHYKHGKGGDMKCAAGMDLETTQVVATGEKGIKWGPCIGGHTLNDPKAHCPHWIRRTREQGEKRVDGVEKSLRMMSTVMPVVDGWRKKEPFGKAEIIKWKLSRAKEEWLEGLMSKILPPEMVFNATSENPLVRAEVHKFMLENKIMLVEQPDRTELVRDQVVLGVLKITSTMKDGKMNLTIEAKEMIKNDEI